MAAFITISRGVDAEPLETQSIMKSDAVWNSQRAAVSGAILGAAYALWICNLANIITLPLIAVVFLAIVTSAACGAALLGGFARFLNYANLVDRRKALRLAPSVPPERERSTQAPIADIF
ncbi:hypothetical protein F2P47_13190 [Parvibaculum sedimenti]|uniref:Uncharacterized protein n=1 Tax=Parvibaculum sedimenti TaxID=2608632 RepID=A0A6N6VEZ1_9HYPH|nr:hypothetical protein [Parvibaculum sedimenti]KAB7739171.1 hypothetical protein F2P47_13190 [Parvibaculum sedimenti]